MNSWRLSLVVERSLSSIGQSDYHRGPSTWTWETMLLVYFLFCFAYYIILTLTCHALVLQQIENASACCLVNVLLEGNFQNEHRSFTFWAQKNPTTPAPRVGPRAIALTTVAQIWRGRTRSSWDSVDVSVELDKQGQAVLGCFGIEDWFSCIWLRLFSLA